MLSPWENSLLRNKYNLCESPTAQVLLRKGNDDSDSCRYIF